MGVGHKQPCDEIFLAGRHARAALAAPALGAIGGERHALDVARVAHGNDHVFALDEVFVLQVAVEFDDFGPARGGELGADGGQLVLDDGHDAGPRTQNVEVVLDAARPGSSIRRAISSRPRAVRRCRRRSRMARACSSDRRQKPASVIR